MVAQPDTGGLLPIEVAYARPDRQLILTLEVPAGTKLREAVRLSGIQVHFPEIDPATATLGIFGQLVTQPDAYSLQAGDRIEIYRPLIFDPKTARLKRAERQQQTRTVKYLDAGSR